MKPLRHAGLPAFPIQFGFASSRAANVAGISFQCPVFSVQFLALCSLYGVMRPVSYSMRKFELKIPSTKNKALLPDWTLLRNRGLRAKSNAVNVVVNGLKNV